MERYGVVLIGCGATSKRHLQAITENKRCELIGVADIVSKRAKESAQKYNARIWETDYKKLIQRDEVDIVIITTWPSSHAEISINSMKAGKHILCEKPITKTLKDAERVLKAVSQTKKKMRIGYILRHNKSYQKMAQMIENGYIGKPIIMRMAGAEHIITRPHWEQDQALIKDTSPIIDCGCHYIDVMRWFTGREATSVTGAGLRVEKETPKNKYDWGIITIRFNDGSVGTYEVGWGHNFRNFNEKEFIGPKGRIRLIYKSHRFEHSEEGDLIEYYSYPDHYEMINVKGELKPTGAQLENLIEYIEKDKDPMHGLKDAYKSLEIILAGHKAIMSGKEQRINR
ncbi:MAG: Gfo/Idh/MocA family oxidoreductase [bacterium]